MARTPMNIRPARMDDLEAVHLLLNQLIPGALEPRKPMWQKLMNAEGYAAWVAEVDGESAGFLDLFLSPDVAHGSTVGLIGNLVVDERFRNQGVGESLLRESIEYSRGQGVVELHVWTGFDNEPAIGLYEKLGFRKRALLMELEV